MPRKKATNKQKAYIQEYNEKNYRRIAFPLHREIDADVLEHLEKQPNKRQYLIALIREDMKRSK